MIEKTEAELAETAEWLRRVKRWGPIVVVGIGVAWLIWRYALWLLWPLIVLAVLFYFVRSPWGAAMRRYLLDNLFYKLFHGKQSATLPFRPLGEFEPADGPRELDHLNWPAPARSDEHAWNRIEYARVAKLLEGMSRDAEGDGWHERRKLVLYHAQLLDALHQAGDDPLKTQAAPATPAASPVRFLGRALTSWHLWIMGALAALAGWQFARAERLDVRADRAIVERDGWHGYAKDLEEAAKARNEQHAVDVARVAREAEASKQYLETERRRRTKLNNDLRRIENEASRAVGADVAIGLRILTEPTDPGPGTPPADPAPTDPSVQPGMSDGVGGAPGPGVDGRTASD